MELYNVMRYFELIHFIISMILMKSTVTLKIFYKTHLFFIENRIIKKSKVTSKWIFEYDILFL